MKTNGFLKSAILMVFAVFLFSSASAQQSVIAQVHNSNISTETVNLMVVGKKKFYGSQSVTLAKNQAANLRVDFVLAEPAEDVNIYVNSRYPENSGPLTGVVLQSQNSNQLHYKFSPWYLNYTYLYVFVGNHY